MSNYAKLQNGSDIRGIAITGVAGQLPNLTPEEAKYIARGFLAWLVKRTGKKPSDLTLAIGRDPRISGAKLVDGLMDGFGPYGCRVLNFGLASTPAMFMACVFEDFRCDGTLMITASHLPFNRNGFKFFTPAGGLNKQDITQILNYAERFDPRDRIGAAARAFEAATPEGEDAAVQAAADAALRSAQEAEREALGEAVNAAGSVHRSGQIIYPAEASDIMTPYSAHLRKLIVEGCGLGDQPLKGMKIVVDAGNGSGGFYARKVLRPLGADISASQYLDPDGMFLNHAPNPEDKEAMQSISLKVLSSAADFGLIFDTDVDRSAAVDSRGREIARNGIVAMAAALVAEDHPGTTVVTDSITSRQLTDFLENRLGLRHFRFKRGYRNVINKAVELNEAGTDCQLAIETSGHAALKENYFLDDGAYLATKIVIRAARLFAEGKRLDSVIEDLEEPADQKEIRIPILATDFGAYGDQVLEDLAQFAREEASLSLEEPNYEGVRINFPGGWCLLRKSLHDPILPMNMASDAPGGCQSIRQTMQRFLAGYEGLDQSVL